MDLFQCSPSLNASQGITANPDISGIGVRTAIYIQAVISLVHPLVAGYDGKIDDFEMKSLATVYLGILLPGCALVLSAIIQSRTFGLSAYHAMIVLFLSWINNTSALTFFAYILGDRMYSRRYQRFEELRKLNSRQNEVIELEREWVKADDLGKWRLLEKVDKKLDSLKSDKNGTKSTSLNRDAWELEIQQLSLWRKKKIMTVLLANQGDRLEFQRGWDDEWENNNNKQEASLRSLTSNAFSWGQLLSQRSILFTGALASTHLTLLSAFGWWFWSTLPNFGINQECIPFIHFVFFTKSIPITSTLPRSLSKSIYIFSSLPGINIVIWMCIFAVGIAMLLLTLSPLAFVAALILACAVNLVNARVRFLARILPTTTGTFIPSTVIPKVMFSLLVYAWSLFARVFFALSIITTFTVQTFLITLTELTIAHNQQLIQSKEGDWTFGQTLALTLALFPLIEVFKFLWEKRPQSPKGRGKSTETRKTGRSGETMETRGALASRETGEGQESGGRGGETGVDVFKFV